MKLAVSSYSFYPLVAGGQMDQLAVMEQAQRMGFAAVEFANLILPEGVSALDYAPRIRQESQRLGLPVINYATGSDFLKRPWQDEVERLKDEIRAAAAMGAPAMRHDATTGFPADHVGGRSFDDALPTLVAAYRATADFAQDLGVKILIENHGLFAQDSERVERLLCAVNHPNFGLLLDIGNFMCADEDPAKAVGRLAPYACHVHAKDFHFKTGQEPNPGNGWFSTRAGNRLRGAIIGHGVVPVVQCLQIVRDAGYDGYLSIEFEGAEDSLKGVAWGADFLRAQLGAALH